MKTLLLLLTLTSMSISPSQGGDAAVDVKKVTKVANSQAEATNWNLDELPHKEWLAEISVKDWTLLHESETKDWHFAVFRDCGDRLIFWNGNKKGINAEMSFAIQPVGNPKTELLVPRKQGEDQPIFTVTHEFSFPEGSATYHNQGSLSQIRSGFKGKIRIEFSVKVAGSFAPAFDQIVEWKKSAEQTGADRRR